MGVLPLAGLFAALAPVVVVARGRPALAAELPLATLKGAMPELLMPARNAR